jgi:hypothetical protein
MKSPRSALLAAIMVLFTVLSASAQSDIVLGKNTGTGRIQFFANDGKGNFTLNICSQVVNGVCVLGEIVGRAVGVGVFNGINGFYKFAGGGVTGTLTSKRNCIVCRWELSGPVLIFELSQFPNDRGVDWLNGTFQLLTMTQTKNVNGVGFNQLAKVNFIILGGVLAPLFCANGPAPCVIKPNLQFTTDKPLQRIPNGQSLFQRFSGTIN